MDKPPPSNRMSIIEQTGAAVLASAIVTTAGGMFWLVVTLPQKLTTLEATVQQLGRTLNGIDTRVERLEEQALDHDKRITRVEVGDR